jgi:hypothetical protein
MYEIHNIRDSVEQFQGRMNQIEDELQAINRELGRQDLLALARRTRELLRRTHGLLEGNATVLFPTQPQRMVDELYKHIEWAQGHVEKALSEEYEFDSIKKRLYMANSLAEHVISIVADAIATLRDQYAMP